jgi:hypothetical protein
MPRSDNFFDWREESRAKSRRLAFVFFSAAFVWAVILYVFLYKASGDLPPAKKRRRNIRGL